MYILVVKKGAVAGRFVLVKSSAPEKPVEMMVAVTGTPRCFSRLAVKRKQCHEVQSLPRPFIEMPRC